LLGVEHIEPSVELFNHAEAWVNLSHSERMKSMGSIERNPLQAVWNQADEQDARLRVMPCTALSAWIKNPKALAFGFFWWRKLYENRTSQLLV
jgi:hypothetical protein